MISDENLNPDNNAIFNFSFTLSLFFVFLLPGQEIGLKGFTPPYLDPTTTGPVVLLGVSYASGGGGILNHTGKIFVSFLLYLMV